MQTFLFALSSLMSLTVAVGQYYQGQYVQQAYDPYQQQQHQIFQPQHQAQPQYAQQSYHHQATYQQQYQPTYQPVHQPSYQPAVHSGYNEPYEQQDPYAAQQAVYGVHQQQPVYAENNIGYGARARGKSGYGDLLHSNDGYGSIHSTGGYTPVIKKKKRKQKIISIDKGLYIPGGTQAFGKFRSLKSCMKACAVSSACFAGDYNPWLGKCYFHGNVTACSGMNTHSKLTHFKKIPCTVPGAPRSRLTLGAQLHGAVEQKGTKSLAGCLKKCLNAGGGVSPTPAMLALPGQGMQVCFGIDYDFSTHKCYFHVVNRRRVGVALSALCPETASVVGALRPVFQPEDLVANPSVINILVCPADV